jgi:cellulose synthase/poly-beta-1,6-N-acetylglucosamine synthase-like glycosyltransferase
VAGGQQLASTGPRGKERPVSAAAAFGWFGWFVIGYFLVLNTLYLGLMMVAAAEAVAASHRVAYAAYGRMFHTRLAVPISIVVPARDKEEYVVGCVGGLLELRYPEFEVIVVEDGSSDATFERLREAFGLIPLPKRIPSDIPVQGRIRSVHAPRGRDNLLVIRKDSAGRPADAVNTGVNAARYPLVCRVDADTYLDESALLAIARPFMDDPESTVAVGTTIRIANGSRIEHGRVTATRMPSGWLARIQVVEYIRAFLLGRAGWSRLHGMLFIPGAFGLYRRDLFVKLGGLHVFSEGDDVEWVVRMHHLLRDAGQRCLVSFVADPCSWTYGPTTYHEIAGQRGRWTQILAEALWLHRRMIGNPRYGLIGTIVMPYFLLFELLSPVVELAALAAFAIGVPLGLVAVKTTVLFIVASIGYAVLLSLAAVAIEELTYHRYPGWRDLALMGMAAVAENVGFRQLHAWWRLRGLWRSARRGQAEWVTPVRDPHALDGLAPQPAAAPAPAPASRAEG